MSIDINSLALAKSYTDTSLRNQEEIPGPQGEPGISPHIGENGNWFIGDKDTGVASQGEIGPQGIQGATGPQGSKGDKGDPGAKGEQGNDGATFIPTVDYNGNLSWSNNQNLPNPATVNIKGPKGDSGSSSGGGNISAKYYQYVSVEPSQWRLVVNYSTFVKYSVADVPSIPVKSSDYVLWSAWIGGHSTDSIETLNRYFELHKTIFEMRSNTGYLCIISSGTTLPDIPLYFNIIVFSK